MQQKKYNWSCYLLVSKNPKYLNYSYVGITNNFIRRLRQHNGEISGGAKYTKTRRPYSLFYRIDHIADVSTALKIERDVKKHNGYVNRYEYMKKIEESILNEYNKYTIDNKILDNTMNNIKLLPLIYSNKAEPAKSKKINWNELKKKVLERDKNTCVYCGGHYDKYMYCIHLDKKKKLDDLKNLASCCKYCFICTHFGNIFAKEVLLCCSDMDQVKINLKTSELLQKTYHMPKITDIDPDAKQAELNIFDFYESISYIGRVPNGLKKYKIFFSPEFDIRIKAKLKDMEFNDGFIFVESEQAQTTESELPNQDNKKNVKITNKEKDIINNINNERESKKLLAYWEKIIKKYTEQIKYDDGKLELEEFEYKTLVS